MEEKHPKSISVIYEKKKDALTFPVGGAYGGPTPDNNGVIVHFYVEYGSLPYSVDMDVLENQQVDMKSGKTVRRGDITREIQSTAFMSAESAIVIGNWLVEKGNLLLNRRKLGGPIEPDN